MDIHGMNPEALFIVLSHIDQGVIVRNTLGDVVFTNLAAANIFGFEDADAFQRTSLEEIARSNPMIDESGDPVHLPDLLSTPIDEALDDASPMVYLRAANPEQSHWYRVRVRSIENEAGERVYDVAVWEDVTERRRAGDRLRLLAAIVATSDDAIVSKTLDGIVTSWNTAAERLYGWTAAEMIGSSITRIVPADKLDELATILQRVGAGELVDHHETSRITRQGHRIDVSVSISPLFDQRGTIVGAAKIARDITVRRDAERFTDAFLADLAHDVNNPLATAKIQSQLLRKKVRRGGLTADEADNAIAAIETSMSRISRRIEELGDVSRLRINGAIELRLAQIDVVELLNGLVRSNQLRERLILARPDTPIIGQWDPQRLERVFDNLISNALKYSSPESLVRISIGTRDGTNGSLAVVSVADRGIGIPPEDLPYVFERFRRGSNVTGSVAGTGIGLAGARQIVELHGGSISIASQPVIGTTVTIELPIALAVDPTIDE